MTVFNSNTDGMRFAYWIRSNAIRYHHTWKWLLSSWGHWLFIRASLYLCPGKVSANEIFQWLTPCSDNLRRCTRNEPWANRKWWNDNLHTWRPFYQHDLASIPTRISNHMVSKVWGVITYLFPNFNGCTVEVWEWISNLPHTTWWM